MLFPYPLWGWDYAKYECSISLDARNRQIWPNHYPEDINELLQVTQDLGSLLTQHA